MTRLTWGAGPSRYEQGLDQGVLYLDEGAVPWNGLVSVEETVSGEVNVDHYFEGNRVHISHVTGDFGGKISAFTYPDVFAEYNGYSERNEYKRFGFAYRTHDEVSHKLHLVYNVLVRDDIRAWNSLKERPDPSLFNWSIYGESVPIPGASPAARLTLESPRDPSVLTTIEDILYGTETTEPRMPTPSEIIELYEAATLLRITYNGDGTYTASGSDEMVEVLPDGRFKINAPSVFLIDEGIFTVSSY